MAPIFKCTELRGKGKMDWSKETELELWWVLRPARGCLRQLNTPVVKVAWIEQAKTLRHLFLRGTTNAIPHSGFNGIVWVHKEAWSILPSFILVFHNDRRKTQIRGQLLLPAKANESHLHVPIIYWMILFLETTVQLAYFTHCVTVHLSLNDKNTEQQIRIKEKSSWPSKPLENWTIANAPTHSGTERLQAKLNRR